MSTGMKLIAIERQRQIDQEGWTTVHDDTHTYGELEKAAYCYCCASSLGTDIFQTWLFEYWPWDAKSWKPKDLMSNLIRAGALYIAASEQAYRYKDEARFNRDLFMASMVAKRIDKILSREVSDANNI